MVRRVRAVGLLVATAALTVACTSNGSVAPESTAASGSSGSSGPPVASPSVSAGSAASAATQVTPPTATDAGTPDTPDTPDSSATTLAAPKLRPQRLTVVMSGDVLLHDGLWKTARIDARRTGRGELDFRPVLADMKPVIAGADLAICHLETPLAPKGGPYQGYPTFAAPPAILPALKWAGYDACTTASNHSLDQGFDGLVRTLRDFDRIGLAHAGTAATRQAARHPLMLHAEGVTVALISATYGTNGIPIPADKPWCVPLIDTDRILATAHRARHAGADIVLVALHWGTQYQNEPSADQRRIAQVLTKSPAIDLIYGHHAHVVQPYDRVNGTWVLYGLGNAVSEQSTPVVGLYDGNTARVTFVRQPDGRFEVGRLQFIPTYMTRYDAEHPARHPMRWLDVGEHLHDSSYARVHDELVAARQRVRRAVNLDGALNHGVTEGH